MILEMILGFLLEMILERIQETILEMILGMVVEMILEMIQEMMKEMIQGMLLDQVAQAVHPGGSQAGSQAGLVVPPQERPRAAQDLKQGQRVRQGYLQQPAQVLGQGQMQGRGRALLQEGVQSWLGTQTGAGLCMGGLVRGRWACLEVHNHRPRQQMHDA